MSDFNTAILRAAAADFAKALLTAVLAAAVVLGAAYVAYVYTVPPQTPTGLEGSY